VVEDLKAVQEEGVEFLLYALCALLYAA